MIETFEFWKDHHLKEHPFFCRIYSKYRRMNHHYLYLACLFKIEELK
jgi:hypothetical protein